MFRVRQASLIAAGDRWLSSGVWREGDKGVVYYECTIVFPHHLCSQYVYMSCHSYTLSIQTHVWQFPYCAYYQKSSSGPFLNVSEPAGQDLFALPTTFWTAVPELEAALRSAIHLQPRTWPQCESHRNTACPQWALFLISFSFLNVFFILKCIEITSSGYTNGYTSNERNICRNIHLKWDI